MSKYINIGVGGHWEADAIGELQICTKDLILNNPELSLQIIQKLSKEQSSSFWHYLLDGPHPSDPQVKKYFDTLYMVINSLDPTQANILKSEYDKLLSEEE